MKKRIFCLLLVLLMLVALLCGCNGEEDDDYYNPELTENSSFAVHFIDVGQADAALILCSGKAMLIDGGNAADSDVMYTYLKKLGVTHLDYVVATHPHEDHVGGIPGALSYATVGRAFAPVQTYNSRPFRNFINKATERGAIRIEVPEPGYRFRFGDAVVTVLGPQHVDYEDPNDWSIVLRLVYGETSFLFTGDMEAIAERDLLGAGMELRSDVLKVGHHGSASSTSYRFLRAVAPKYAVIPVGQNNEYGHPTEVVLSRLRDAEVKVFRTDMQGDIVCVSDGKNLTFTTARNQDVETNPTVHASSTWRTALACSLSALDLPTADKEASRAAKRRL